MLSSSFRFLSFTQLEDEISLIIDTQTLRTFPAEHLDVVLEDPWIPMKREKKKDLQETGVVCILHSSFDLCRLQLLLPLCNHLACSI